MKKFFAMLLSLLCVILGLSACTNGGNSSGNGNGNYTPPSGGTGGNGNVLIAYFSCTGTTKGVAEKINHKIGGTLYEIIAADPYTAEDLDYYSGGRADQEQADSSARPEISGSVKNMDKYDIVFIGYPIVA